MDLKIYKGKGRWGHLGSSEVGMVNIHRRGRIGLNSFLVRTLKLDTGDRMIMAQDLDTRNDWYISFGEDNTEGYRMSQLRAKQPGKGLVAYYSREAINNILDSVKAETSATFLVGTNSPKQYDGRTWYRVLTATPKLIR